MNTIAELNDSLIGRYLVEKEIGQGGMASVYLARDLRHDRKVAIKVIHPELAAVLGPDRFVTEMKVTANLQHPHILPLFDSGTVRSQLFYVMPFVDGESLRDRLTREQQLPIDDAIRVATEVGSALDYAHRHGVVHRDIKPENILLHDGSAIVADFGIALAVSNAGGARLTQTGLSLGTPQYMSPEQATGDKHIDGRTDVYSLGCVLYEMLTGEPPFTGPNSQAIVAKVLTEAVRSPQSRRATISNAVDDAVIRALHRAPADRFATASGFVAALQASGSATATPARTIAPRAGRRRWLWPGLTCLAAACAIWVTLRPPPNTEVLQLTKQVTHEGNVSAVALSPDGKSVAYVTDDCLTGAPLCHKTLWVRDIDGTNAVPIASKWRLLTEVKWSPDGSLLALIGAQDTATSAVYLVDRLGGSFRPIRVKATAIGFSPDGKELALAAGVDGHQRLVRFNIATLAPVDSVSFANGLSVADLAFSPNGGTFAAIFFKDDWVLGLFNVDGTLSDSIHASSPRVRWAHQGKAIVMLDLMSGVIADLRSYPVVGGRIQAGKVQAILTQVQSLYFDIALNDRVVITLGPTQYQLQRRTNAGWQVMLERTGWIAPSNISPDGRDVAVTVTDNIADNILAIPMDSGPTRSITANHGGNYFPAWSPNGRVLAFYAWHDMAGRLGFVSSTGGGERYFLTGVSFAPSWLSDSSVLTAHLDTLLAVDTTGRVFDHWVMPSGMAFNFNPILSPARDRLVYWSNAASAVIVADLPRKTFAIFRHSPFALTPVAWGHDGSVFAVAESDRADGLAQREPRLVRIPPDGGTPVPAFALPPFSVLMAIDVDAQHAVALVQRSHPDLWVGAFR